MMIGGAPTIFTVYIIVEVVLAAAVLIYEFCFDKDRKKKST